MINLSQFTTVFPHVTVTGSDAQDGLIISGRSGGLNYFRVSLSPAALTGNRNITIPNVDGAVVTTGDVGTVSDAMVASITSAGKVANSATTADSSNTPFAIVSRDSNGNFAAGIITAALSGNSATASALQTPRTITFTGSIDGALTTDFSGNESVTLGINPGVIVNSNINASAAISDTKLATIQTSGKVANSATTATNLNAPSSIVSRDSNGNFIANIITASLSGNAATATSLQIPRIISFTGDVTGSTTTAFSGNVTTDLSIATEAIYDDNISSSAAIADGKLATIQTSGKVANSATTATSANTANTIVARDGGGNFVASTITASLNGTALYAQTAGPVGAIVYFPSYSPPFGFLVANGTQLNTYAYRNLHAVIGGSWGGSPYIPGVTDQPGATTTFNLPDLRDRFIVGSGFSYATGDIGGANTVALTIPQMPYHTHAFSNGNYYWIGQVNVAPDFTFNDSGGPYELSTSQGIEPAGANQPHENRPPYFALLPCIKY